MNNNIYRYIKENELNDYEKENKRLSYKNLFYNDESLILCNNIANDWEDLEQQNGFNDCDDCYEIYQYYIIDDDTAKRLINYTNEIIFYHNRLDIYILGVTHYGTSWSYVLTEFKLVKDDENGYYKAIEGDDEDDENND